MNNPKYIFPNFITILNLLCGSVAIVLILEDQILQGTYFIVLAAVFDLLDGLVAKLLKATSDFGKELDSLCDLVSFGVAPSTIMYKLLGISLSLDFVQASMSEKIILLGAFLFTVAAALRLARFNIAKYNSSDFIGMPVPAATLTIVAFFWLVNSLENDLLLNTYVLYAVIFLL